MGYDIGALLAGLIADYLNLTSAILFVGGITLLSTLYIFIRMNKLGRPIKKYQQVETKV